MGTKCVLKTAGDPPGYRKKIIEAQAGNNWVAVPVAEDVVPVLQLIVPRGKTSFPCPHLIKDEQGKNWLVRPFMHLGEGAQHDLETPRTGACGARAVLPARGKVQQLMAVPAEKTPKKQRTGFDNTVLVSDAFQLAPKLSRQITAAGAEKVAAISRAPQAAGKPKNPQINLMVPKKTSSFSAPKLAASASIFAPAQDQENPAPAPSAKAGCYRPDNSPVAPAESAGETAETYLAEPAWKRLKAKATKKGTGDFGEAAKTADIEIFTAPPAAWKLWMRRLLPAVSIALLAAGSWQLVGGL